MPVKYVLMSLVLLLSLQMAHAAELHSIEILSNGRVLDQGPALNRTDFLSEIHRLAKSNPKPKFLLQVDSVVSFETVGVIILELKTALRRSVLQCGQIRIRALPRKSTLSSRPSAARAGTHRETLEWVPDSLAARAFRG